MWKAILAVMTVVMSASFLSGCSSQSHVIKSPTVIGKADGVKIKKAPPAEEVVIEDEVSESDEVIIDDSNTETVSDLVVEEDPKPAKKPAKKSSPKPKK